MSSSAAPCHSAGAEAAEFRKPCQPGPVFPSDGGTHAPDDFPPGLLLGAGKPFRKRGRSLPFAVSVDICHLPSETVFRFLSIRIPMVSGRRLLSMGDRERLWRRPPDRWEVFWSRF